jgi:hypothetical protein
MPVYFYLYLYFYKNLDKCDVCEGSHKCCTRCQRNQVVHEEQTLLVVILVSVVFDNFLAKKVKYLPIR